MILEDIQETTIGKILYVQMERLLRDEEAWKCIKSNMKEAHNTKRRGGKKP